MLAAWPPAAANIGAAASLTGSQSIGAGAIDQVFNLNFADDSVLNGASSNLGSLSVTVTGNVWGHASPSISGTTISLPPLHVGDTHPVAGNNAILVTNLAGYRVNLKTSGGSASAGNITLSGDLSGLTPGGSGGSISASAFVPATQPVGVINQTFPITFADDSTLLGANNVGSSIITVSGVVYAGLSTWASNAGGAWGTLASGSEVELVGDQRVAGLGSQYGVERHRHFRRFGRWRHGDRHARWCHPQPGRIDVQQHIRKLCSR